MFILCILMCLQSLIKFHHCPFKILRKNQNVADWESQRAIALKELAPSPYFSIINVHLVDINVFAKFYKNSVIAFWRYWKTKTSWMDRLTMWKQYTPPPPRPRTPQTQFAVCEGIITCAQRRLRSALGIHPVWSESSLSAWRNIGPLTTYSAHSEDSG